MATIKKGILGGFSGKVGTVVGANFKGLDVMRSLPVKSKKAASEKQELQRSIFATASQFLQPLNETISLYFGGATGTLSSRNVAMSYMMNDVLETTANGIVIRYNKFLITRGNLVGFQNVQMNAQNGAIHIGWEDNSSQGNAKATDVFCMAVYCESANLWYLQEEGDRSTADANIVLPDAMKGNTVNVYVYFRDVEKTASSTSLHLGEITVA